MLETGEDDHQAQTIEEWWDDYDRAGSGIVGLSHSEEKIEHATPHEHLTGGFEYASHRTTKLGRLVLDFHHCETGITVSCFFNVDIKNAKSGRSYRVGSGGQFSTRKGHKFRAFWMGIIGSPPQRWARVHTEMHKLRKIRFVGKAVRQSGYWKAVELKKC